MGARTGISWTDATWNPVTGCTAVSEGCTHCYARTLQERFRGVEGHYYEHGFDLILRPQALDQPIRWQRPRRIFVNSQSDVFHAGIDDAYIAKIFAVMAVSPKHEFQLLTKRHGRMASLLNTDEFWQQVQNETAAYGPRIDTQTLPDGRHALPNLQLGVSVESQQWADIRIDALLRTPAWSRFLSMEPLLGAVDLFGPADATGHRAKPTYWLTGRPTWTPAPPTATGPAMQDLTIAAKIDQVIVGGESGPGARPMHPTWAALIRDQCAATQVAFFFKQWGAFAPAEPDESYSRTNWVRLDGSSYPGDSEQESQTDVLMYRTRDKNYDVLEGSIHHEYPAMPDPIEVYSNAGTRPVLTGA